jgi:precorrin-8X/cobalt-precorrin-8 methylmutase
MPVAVMEESHRIGAPSPRALRAAVTIKDPRLADIAQAKNMTKTCAAVDLWAEEGKLDGAAVVGIG